MTSKTFKTARADNKVLSVDNLFGNPRLLIKEFDGDTRGFVFAPSDAPALALAILEAAGFDDVDSGNTSCAVADLRTFIARQERITAEAEAQAKLEAEALELMNVRLRASGTTVHLTKATVDPVALDGWLAVARKAREINKENQ